MMCNKRFILAVLFIFKKYDMKNRTKEVYPNKSILLERLK